MATIQRSWIEFPMPISTAATANKAIATHRRFTGRG